MQDHADHAVYQRREDQRPKILLELIPRPCPRFTDAESRPGRWSVARSRWIAGRGSVARWRRVAGGRPVAGLWRRPLGGWRGCAIPRRRPVAGLRLSWGWTITRWRSRRRSVTGWRRVVARIGVTPVGVVWVARVLRRVAHSRSCSSLESCPGVRFRELSKYSAAALRAHTACRVSS